MHDSASFISLVPCKLSSMSNKHSMLFNFEIIQILYSDHAYGFRPLTYEFLSICARWTISFGPMFSGLIGNLYGFLLSRMFCS